MARDHRGGELEFKILAFFRSLFSPACAALKGGAWSFYI